MLLERTQTLIPPGPMGYPFFGRDGPMGQPNFRRQKAMGIPQFCVARVNAVYHVESYSKGCG